MRSRAWARPSGSPPASRASPTRDEPHRARVERAVVIVEPALDAVRIARESSRARGRRHRSARPPSGAVATSATSAATTRTSSGSGEPCAEHAVERVAPREPAVGGDPRVEPRRGRRRPAPPTPRARSTARRRGAGRAARRSAPADRAARAAPARRPARRARRTRPRARRARRRSRPRGLGSAPVDLGAAARAAGRRRRGAAVAAGGARRGARAATPGREAARGGRRRALGVGRRGRRPLEARSRRTARSRARSRASTAPARPRSRAARSRPTRRAARTRCRRSARRGTAASGGRREPQHVAAGRAQDRAQPLAAQRWLDDRAGRRVHVGHVGERRVGLGIAAPARAARGGRCARARSRAAPSPAVTANVSRATTSSGRYASSLSIAATPPWRITHRLGGLAPAAREPQLDRAPAPTAAAPATAPRRPGTASSSAASSAEPAGVGQRPPAIARDQQQRRPRRARSRSASGWR